MRIPDFQLERFFARYEFSVPYLLCASDVEGWPMAEVLALADDDVRALWDGLKLGYTESMGHPLLREAIAQQLFERLTGDDVLVFSGASEDLRAGQRPAPGGRPRRGGLAGVPVAP